MVLEDNNEVRETKSNKISINGIPVSADDIQMDNSRIVFRGRNNILWLEDSVKLKDCTLSFFGDNALVYLSSNKKHLYRIKLDAWSNTTTFFGRDNYFNGILSAIVSERQNLIVGEDGVFSFGIWMRTADPHLLYDAHTKKRINNSRSIIIGDHVWIGQNAMVLKGTTVGSGSIIAACSVLAGKKVQSNSVYGGNPARLLKEEIFFSGESVHNYTEQQTQMSMMFNHGDQYIYSPQNEIILDELTAQLTAASGPNEKLRILNETIVSNSNKNRFFVKRSSGKARRKRLFFR